MGARKSELRGYGGMEIGALHLLKGALQAAEAAHEGYSRGVGLNVQHELVPHVELHRAGRMAQDRRVTAAPGQRGETSECSQCLLV